MENTNVTEQSTNEIMPMAASGETNFASLPEKTTPASGDMFLMEDSEDTKKINYDKLADAILNKLTSKTYSGLETTAKNFVTAINELNSKSEEGYLQGHSVVNKQLNDANIDEVWINGFYVMVNPTGGTLPFSDNLTHALIVCGNNSATGKFYASQIAIRFSDGLIRVRVGSNGVWNGWKTIS